MPPISEKAAEMEVGGAGVMAQSTSSGLPRYVGESEYGISDQVSMKRKTPIELGAAAHAAQVEGIGEHLTSEEYLRKMPPKYRRCRGRKLEALPCAGR